MNEEARTFLVTVPVALMKVTAAAIGSDILVVNSTTTASNTIKAIGSLIDYTPRYPDTVFANALWGFRPILDAAIADAQAGKSVGKNYTAFGLMKEGGSDIAYVKGVAPTDAEAWAFLDRLQAAGQFCKRRTTKGRDFMAACGQLGNRALSRRSQPVLLNHK